MEKPSEIQNVPLPLIGQSALVTGATSGIGKAIAIALAKAGAQVAVNFLDDFTAAIAVVKEIEQLGVKGSAYRGDVTSEVEVEAIFEAAVRDFGTLDILIANAGIQMDAPFEDMTLDQWERVLKVNLTGQFLCARAAVREFKRRGLRPEISHARGKIICISSVHQQVPWAGHANYAASKGGVKLMMESLALEMAPRRIRVNAIAPGVIRTPLNAASWSSDAAVAKLLQLIPYGRIGEPDDIAKAAVWLASDASDYVTGATLIVDGGLALYLQTAFGGQNTPRSLD